MKHNRIIALLIAIVLCLAMAFSVAFIVLESDHDCIGEHCEICLEIEACVNLLRGIGFAVLTFLIAVALGHISYKTPKPSEVVRWLDTLVALKVKLTI